MRKLWPAIVTLVGLLGVVASIAGLPTTSPWRTPLILVCVLLLAGGILVSLVAWFFRPAPWAVLPACKELGIGSVHVSGDGGPRMSHHLARAKEIRIMAVAAVTLLHRQKPHFVRALRDGATIRILVAEPSSIFVRDIEEAESASRAGNISRELEVVEGLLNEFLAEAGSPVGGRRGHILLGRYSTHLRSSIIVCDKDWGWLTLNLAPKRAQHSCSFVLTPTTGGLLSDAIAHFDRVWTIVERRSAIVDVSAR